MLPTQSKFQTEYSAPTQRGWIPSRVYVSWICAFFNVWDLEKEC